MMILYRPQWNSGSTISYSFNGENITVNMDGITYTFDFTNLADGSLQNREPQPPFCLLINTVLPVIPILSAKREDGTLWVELLNFINDNAAEEERFPVWQEV